MLADKDRMNYSNIKKELLIGLRGDLTQKEMSESLGYKFNQYHKWESDIKWLRWDEFIDILEVSNSPYKKAFHLVLAYYDDPKDIKLLFQTLCANLSMKEIGQLVGHRESIVRRWITDNISPSVETILKLINDRTNNLYEFINQLIDIEKIPTLKLKYQQVLKQKMVEIQFPFASAIEAAIQLDDYKKQESHSDKWIAERILVSEVLVKKAITALVSAETIQKKGNKYCINNSWIQVPGLTLAQVAKIDHYWTARCLDRYMGPDGVPFVPDNKINTNFRSFRVAPLSEEAAIEIQKLLKKTSSEVLEIVKKDNHPYKKIGVYVSHFFDVKDIKWVQTNTVDEEI